MRKTLEKLVSLYIIMILALAPLSDMLAEDYTAQTMRLLRYEGEVEIQDPNGKPRFVMENVRFKSGEAMLTGQSSLASVGLDNTKIVTLDQNTRVEFFKDGGHLRLKLTEGSILLDVSEKLDENESLDVETSTMTVGIRGTSLGVSEQTVNGMRLSRISTLEGVAQVSYLDETGVRQSFQLPSGYTAVAQDQNGNGLVNVPPEIRKTIKEDTEGFIDTQIQRDPQLRIRVEEASAAQSGMDKEENGRSGMGATGSPVIPPHTHTGGTATCTEAAICDACGQPYGDPLGHVEEAVPAVAATCAEAGLTAGVKCARCGEILTAQEETSALGHQPETIPAAAPTCTEPGLSEGVKCARCGEILTAQEETSALGHDWGEWTNVYFDADTCMMNQERICQRDESHVETREEALEFEEKLPDETIIKSGNKTYQIVDGNLTLISVDPGTDKRITIPDVVEINGLQYAVRKIAGNAFENCGDVTFIRLGKYVNNIAANAFTGCNSLNELRFRSSSKVSISKYAFSGVPSKVCTNLTIKVNKKMSSKYYKKLKAQLKKAGVSTVNMSKKLVLNTVVVVE